MQNVIEICKELGIEVPEEKQGDLSKKVAENYVTRAEHEKKLGKAEAERDSAKERADAAEETLKGFEGIDPSKVQGELDAWKRKAEEAEENAKQQIYARDFADALKAELESVKFTSEAAKRDVVSQIEKAGLKLRDGKILGLTDLIAQIKKADSSAFVDEQQEQLEQDKARFTTSMSNQRGVVGNMTKRDIMAIKDPVERQQKIAENMSLFQK